MAERDYEETAREILAVRAGKATQHVTKVEEARTILARVRGVLTDLGEKTLRLDRGQILAIHEVAYYEADYDDSSVLRRVSEPRPVLCLDSQVLEGVPEHRGFLADTSIERYHGDPEYPDTEFTMYRAGDSEVLRVASLAERALADRTAELLNHERAAKEPRDAGLAK
jgi:hypothetical protein